MSIFEESVEKGMSFVKGDYWLFLTLKTDKKVGIEYAYKKARNSFSALDKLGFVEGFNLGKEDLIMDENRAREKYSLSCKKCDGLAYPVVGTDKHYECSCGYKFISSQHPRFNLWCE